jgi:hypothetical protein
MRKVLDPFQSRLKLTYDQVSPTAFDGRLFGGLAGKKKAKLGIYNQSFKNGDFLQK